MKFIYKPFVLCFLIMLTSFFIRAQNTFDSKKKQNIPINTTSLKATPIKIPIVNSSTARNATFFPIFQNRTFIKPSQQKLAPPTIIYDQETGLPSFIISEAQNNSARKNAGKDPSISCFNYLQELEPFLRLDSPKTKFLLRSLKTDERNKTHMRLVQHYKGIPVYGAEIIVHLDEFGDGEAFNGTYFTISGNIEPVPVVSKQVAIENVSTHLHNGKTWRALNANEKKFVQYEQPNASLCIYPRKDLAKTFVLAYRVISCPALDQRWEYFIDAGTGAVLHRFQVTCLADGPRTATANDMNGVSRLVNTYQKGTSYYMLDASRPMFKLAGSVLPDEPIGGILTIDMNNTFGKNQSFQHATSTNNVWSTANQAKVVSAHFNAGVAYEYFRTKHNRNSIDGNGGTILSIVNVPDETGSALDNAFWNGKAMFYGNGNTSFKPLAASMDVAGHEMTHGVVENTANLEYQGESGAINESMADIFGSMMDPADWLIGEDIVKLSAFPSGALRSLADPHNGGTSLANLGYQPRHMSEAYKGSEDNGGVHINSGIPNYAFYKYASAITRDKAASVFYKALDDYLTKSSKFIDLRLAVIKAAGDLYGTSSNEVTQAGVAFDAVGIGNGQAGNYTETLPGHPGSEFLLVYNTDAIDPNTLYRSSLDGSVVSALSTTGFSSKPSITDNGQTAVFVAANHTIHVITVAPGAATQESVLQNEAIWSNVVISKGGTKIAAVTLAQEPSIYVYDFSSKVWSKFTLYNPTYSQGISSAGPVYANALEWDYTGEFLVYDCFNRLDNSSGTDIEYWDVNFIRVWNNSSNKFGDGTVAKLFPSIPVGVSIGNPSFAKNSPNILAFDYIDDNIQEYAVLGCNIETNDVNVIASNNTLGWPSYNKNDSRLAFTSLDANTKFQTNYISLNTDKISASTAAIGLFSDTKWPVYFSVGNRVLEDKIITGVEEEVEGNTTVTCYPNPFNDELSVLLKDSHTSRTSVELVNLLGKKVYEYSAVTGVNTEAIQLNLSSLQSGCYTLRILTGTNISHCKVVKK